MSQNNFTSHKFQSRTFSSHWIWFVHLHGGFCGIKEFIFVKKIPIPKQKNILRVLLNPMSNRLHMNYLKYLLLFSAFFINVYFYICNDFELHFMEFLNGEHWCKIIFRRVKKQTKISWNKYSFVLTFSMLLKF